MMGIQSGARWGVLSYGHSVGGRQVVQGGPASIRVLDGVYSEIRQDADNLQRPAILGAARNTRKATLFIFVSQRT